MPNNETNPLIHIRKEDIVTLPSPTNEYPFKLCQFGYTYPDTTYHHSSIDTEIYRLEYVISGKGIINTKNYSFTVEGGDTYLLHQGDTHNYYSDSKDPMHKIWINVYGVLAHEIVKIYKLSDVVVFKQTNSFDSIKKMHDLCSENLDIDELQIKSAALFLEIIAFLSKQHQMNNSKLDALDNARLYIDSHITENISISKLAKISKLSEIYFARIFKQRYDITPHQYILKNKLRLAKTLLRSTNKSIEEISDMLSLSNPVHLNKIFKKYVGITPSQYRKENFND